MATVAPSAAPEETPSTNESAIGFLNTPCRQQPETASAAPTKKAPIAWGGGYSKKILYIACEAVPSSTRANSANENPNSPKKAHTKAAMPPKMKAPVRSSGILQVFGHRYPRYLFSISLISRTASPIRGPGRKHIRVNRVYIAVPDSGQVLYRATSARASVLPMLLSKRMISGSAAARSSSEYSIHGAAWSAVIFAAGELDHRVDKAAGAARPVAHIAIAHRVINRLFFDG